MKVPTLILYKEKKFSGVGFNEDLRSVDDVRCRVNESSDGEISGSYSIEIEDAGDFVVLTQAYLRYKRPWCQDEHGEDNNGLLKKVKLKITEPATDRSSGKIHEYRFRSCWYLTYITVLESLLSVTVPQSRMVSSPPMLNSANTIATQS